MDEYARDWDKPLNLRYYIDNQLHHFIEKFKKHGWRQEDLHYITKKTHLQEWDLGIVFYSELLEYEENGKEILTPWIVGRLEIETIDYGKLREYTDFILDELNKMDIKPFHDEDSFMGYFSKEDHKGWTQLKFFINERYPDGYWENHTL